MNQDINKILTELYQSDPSLQQKEKQLEKIIQAMLDVKPNAKIDPNFKVSLKSQLQQAIYQDTISHYQSNTKLSFFQKLSYFVGVVGMACFAFILLKDTIWESSFIGEKKQVRTTDVSTSRLSKLSGDVSSDILGDSSVEGAQVPERNMQKTFDSQAPLLSEEKTIDAAGSSDLSVSEENNHINAIERESMMMDEMPAVGMGLMKSASTDEYIPDVYVYSFSGELNLDFSDTFPTYKKPSSYKSYFIPELLELEKKSENILKVALKGGKDGLMDTPSYQKKNEHLVILKNPKIVYTNTYHFSRDITYEYFTPSVVFEVEKSDNPQIYQTEIIVPLVKEIYTYDENGNIIGLK